MMLSSSAVQGRQGNETMGFRMQRVSIHAKAVIFATIFIRLLLGSSSSTAETVFFQIATESVLLRLQCNVQKLNSNAKNVAT